MTSEGRERKGTSPWVWVGVGCGVVTLVLVLAVAGLAFFGWRAVQTVKQGVEDPATRLANARKILGVEEMPGGYHVMAGFSILGMFDVVVLSDQEPGPSGKIDGFDRHGFVYLHMIGGPDHEKLRREFQEGGDPSKVFAEARLNVDTRKEIAHGAIDLGQDGAELYWLATRGSTELEHARFDGINTILFWDCPGLRGTRMGIWMGKAPDESGVDVDWTGTPADPGAIREFVSKLAPCGQSDS